jgi:Flp pilus assembly protein TadG
MLEFALVIPIFVFVLYGLIAFGIMLSAKQSMVNAASEGARAAVGASPTQGQQLSDAQVAAAKAAVGRDLQDSVKQYDVNDTSEFNAQVNPCDAASPSGPKCIFVDVTYPYSSKPLVPKAPGLGLVTPDKLSAHAVVQVPG